jgi:ribonuclease P protein component
MRKSLTSRERLKARAELKNIFASASNTETRGIKLFYIENSLPWNRIAVCPVRGFRKAVQRNRQKRLCREAYRQLKERIKPGYDLAFVLYPGTYGFSERLDQMHAVLDRAGLKR